MRLTQIVSILVALCPLYSLAYEVIYAINAGGEGLTDTNGVKYSKDPLMGKTGTASDYGKQLMMINRVKPNDEILYQTERYHSETFGYDVPIAGDGDYMLVLKFCEVYFNAPNMKVFDVVMNHRHVIVSELDIFSLVGRGMAHDEYVKFTVSRNKLYWKDEESEIRGGKIRVDLMKGIKDNPKINAIALVKGDVDSFPRLPPPVLPESQLPFTNEINEQPAAAEEVVTEKQQSANRQQARKTSGPKQANPYSLDESSMMLPIFIAIGAFIPLLFCLCRL